MTKRLKRMASDDYEEMEREEMESYLENDPNWKEIKDGIYYSDLYPRITGINVSSFPVMLYDSVGPDESEMISLDDLICAIEEIAKLSKMKSY